MSDGSARVGIVMGSDSDLEVLEEAARVLERLGVPYEMTVASAHRSPEWTRRWLAEATARGVRVLIAGAGGAAALPGFLAAETAYPVIGVPIPSALNGLDSLLSMAQMPRGVPVATMAIGKAGAANAGILAAQILALGSGEVARRLATYRAEQAREVEVHARKLAARGSGALAGGAPGGGSPPGAPAATDGGR